MGIPWTGGQCFVHHGVNPGEYMGMAWDFLTLVTNVNRGIGGVDCFCTSVARSPGKDPGHLLCRRHNGDGAGNTAYRNLRERGCAYGCGRYYEMNVNLAKI